MLEPIDSRYQLTHEISTPNGRLGIRLYEGPKTSEKEAVIVERFRPVQTARLDFRATFNQSGEELTRPEQSLLEHQAPMQTFFLASRSSLRLLLH